MKHHRAAFLDRDGVINAMWWDPEHGTMDSPANPEQFRLLPNVGKAIQMLRDMGLLIVIVSNQPGIAKGKMGPRLLKAITGKMNDELAKARTKVDAIYYCLHHPGAIINQYRVICNCRKPRPGLLQQAAAELNIDLSRSSMVGDGTTDVRAGKAVGCTTILLGSAKCERCQILSREASCPDFMADDLFAAAKLIRGFPE